MRRLARMWHALTQHLRHPVRPSTVHYDARTDPVVRWLKKEQLDSERRTRHNTPIRTVRERIDVPKGGWP